MICGQRFEDVGATKRAQIVRKGMCAVLSIELVSIWYSLWNEHLPDTNTKRSPGFMFCFLFFLLWPFSRHHVGGTYSHCMFLLTSAYQAKTQSQEKTTRHRTIQRFLPRNYFCIILITQPD